MRTMEEDNFNALDLLRKVMNKNWISVAEAYRNNRSVRRAKLTRKEQTVLHLAVWQKDDNVVEQLINAMDDDEARDVLLLKDNLGDITLHNAAALGLAKICWLLAEKCKELVVSARNNMGETPLYVAVHHGKNEAFFVLQDYVPTSLMRDDLSFCRRGDGNTILHAAVHGTNFELAIEIIELYPRLVNFNNNMGQSPLHLLANKPLVFKSGSPPQHIFKLLYPYIIVDMLQPKYQPKIYMSSHYGWKEETKIKILHNYASLEIKMPIIYHVYRLIVSCFGERSIMNCNTANKGQSSKDSNKDGLHAHTSEGQERDEEYRKHVRPTKPRFSENCNTVFDFLKTVINVLMVPLRIGHTAFNFLKIVIKFLMVSLVILIIEPAKRDKTMHDHANQVMTKLINMSSYWDYEESGKMLNTPDEESSTNSSESLEGEVQIKRQQIDEDKEANKSRRDSPILVAAKMGIVEMIKNILDTFPIAIEDLDYKHRNIILLSVEHQQQKVYKYMLERKPMLDSVFAVVDKYGNSALHIAAGATWNTYSEMQWESKWYKFVRDSMEPSFFQLYNNKGQTAKEIYFDTHQSLLEERRERLRHISYSNLVFGTLFAIMLFDLTVALPASIYQSSGFPTMMGDPILNYSTIGVLTTFFISIATVEVFHDEHTSPFQGWHLKILVPLIVLMGSLLYVYVNRNAVEFHQCTLEGFKTSSDHAF